jgi:hypothetical protein
LRLLTAKFGALPEATVAKINAVSYEPELAGYLDRLLTSNSLEDVGLAP